MWSSSRLRSGWLSLSIVILTTCFARTFGADGYYNKYGKYVYYDDGADGNDDQDQGNETESNYYGRTDDWAATNADIVDDDLFHWDNNVGFDGVSIMPVSCVNYNNGHMIKFAFFETDTSYQCHFSEIGGFVVSIAHYMRAYFNYQALLHGEDFELPGDVGYLNCIQLQATTFSDEPLYAKIGCKDRETFTSTRLALRLYTDATCSTPYDDGYPSKRHSTKGYETKGGLISSDVSFRPPFYTCHSCSPDVISETFNKRHWYDDDYINNNNNNENNAAQQNNENQDNGDEGDDYFVDDAYLSANDDVNRNRRLDAMETESIQATSIDSLKAFAKEFWESVDAQKRKLYENNYDIGEWNMCQRVYKYGMWCDEECRSLDAFRTDEWSTSDILLLSMVCVFMAAMMLLAVAKRLKAAKKRKSYGQENLPLPGIPPVSMLGIYIGILVIIIVMATLRFVNETLVFAVVLCILLFIYILKLTLFDNRRPVLLATAHHDVWDNPMDERLFT